MIYPLERDDVLWSVAIEELVLRKLTVPTTETTLKDFSTYDDPPSIQSDLTDGQSHEINQLTVQGC